MKCEACDNTDEDQAFCEGCDCCPECCDCTPTDCDCDVCADRRASEIEDTLEAFDPTGELREAHGAQVEAERTDKDA